MKSQSNFFSPSLDVLPPHRWSITEKDGEQVCDVPRRHSRTWANYHLTQNSFAKEKKISLYLNTSWDAVVLSAFSALTLCSNSWPSALHKTLSLIFSPHFSCFRFFLFFLTSQSRQHCLTFFETNTITNWNNVFSKISWISSVPAAVGWRISLGSSCTVNRHLSQSKLNVFVLT